MSWLSGGAGRARLTPCIALIALIGGLVAGVGAAPAAAVVAGAAAPASNGASPTGAVDPQVVASRAARASGKPVEVAGEQTASSTVYAQPDGSMRAVFTAVPTRVRRGAGWVPIDTALRPGADGTLVAAAIEQPLVLSGGGTGTALVSLGGPSGRLDLWWPGALPVPKVTGSAATYADVLPGVDLRAAATEAGFTVVLAVKDRAAGLRLLASPPTLRVTSPGLSVRADGRGGLVARDAGGAVVFAAPSARMWDASAGADSGHADRTAAVGLGLAGSTLTLSPDRAMLTDRGTRFPVYIDPSFTAGLLNWTDVLAQSPGVSFWNGQNLADPTDPNGPIMVGLDPYYLTAARALFQMNTAPINGKHVLGATFRITEGWANSCTASEVDLWLTGGIDSGTTWNSQPSWSPMQSSVNAAHRTGSSGSCAAAQVAFDATGAVQSAAANNWGNLTLGLRAANEGDTNSWKRFQKDATLQVDYNSIATVGAMSALPSMPCVSGGSSPSGSDPVINNPTPTLIASANDADTAENNLRGDFVWQSWNGSSWVGAGSGTDPIGRAANTQTSYTIPSGALSDAVTYRWQVQIADPLQSPYSGTDYSAWSGWCEFVADFTPPAAPAVASSVYTSGCAPCGGVGISTTFTLSDSSNDVVQYYYGFSDPPSVQLTPAAQGGSVSFAWTPPSGGPYTLYVQARDRGTNISAQTRYSFTVATPAGLLAQWLLQDKAGSSTLADTTGNGHTATLAGGGTLGAPSRIVGQGALSLDGSPTNWAVTSTPVLDTSKSFTVSAWVKPTALTAYPAVVSQDGAHTSAFQLQADSGSCGCWRLILPAGDSAGTGVTTLNASGTIKLGLWTHLAAVYDAGAGTATIYVNGAAAGSVSGLGARWNATGPFAIGRDRWTDASTNFFLGSISTVEAWQRVLYPAEIQALYDPTTGGLVEANSFENPGGAGTIETAAPDPMNLLHDLALQGTASVPLSGAGYQGLGLALDGAGYADSSIDSTYNNTPDQVLHTDQSFTVSAWVKLTGSSLPTRTMTAVSQLGSATSAFFLGYRTSGTNGVWSFAMAGGDTSTSPGSTEADSAALPAGVLNTWTKLTGVYDAVAGTMTLYVNGQLAADVTRSASATPWDATGNFTVGAARWSPSGGSPSMTDFWVGDIDEVRAYQGVLVAPAADWQFTGCTGTPVVCPDLAAGNHPLTLSGTGASIANVALPSTQPGPVLSLDGAAGVATTAVPVIDTGKSFTVGAWVRAPSVPVGGSHVMVSQSGNYKSFFELKYDGDLKKVCFAVFSQDSATNSSGYTACGPNLTAGQWMYVAGVYDEVAGTLKLYSAAFGGTPTLAATTAYTSPWYDTGTNAQVRIGSGYNGGGVPTAFFGGNVTDVQLYPGIVGDLSTLM